jgi:hypothetical protein
MCYANSRRQVEKNTSIANPQSRNLKDETGLLAFLHKKYALSSPKSNKGVPETGSQNLASHIAAGLRTMQPCVRGGTTHLCTPDIQKGPNQL